MESLQFLNKSIKNEEDRLKGVSTMKALLGDTSGLGEFIDTSKFQCYILQYNDAILHLKEDHVPTSEDFILNEDTGYYDFNISIDEDQEVFDLINKVILPESLIIGIYYPNKRHHSLPLNYIKAAFDKHLPENSVKKVKRGEYLGETHPSDLYLFDKEFGDITCFYGEDYTFYVKTIVMKYSEYKDSIEDSLLGTWPAERTGLIDEINERNISLDISELCEDICLKLKDFKEKSVLKE